MNDLIFESCASMVEQKILRDKLEIAFALDISGVHSLLSKCKKVTTL